MKKLILALSIFALFSCSGSSSSKKTGGGEGSLEDACAATTVEEYFEAMAGSFELTAIDTFTEREPPEQTEDDTFVHEESYVVSFSKNQTLSVKTEKGEKKLTFGDNEEDKFDPYAHVVYVSLFGEDFNLAARVSCEEEGEGIYSLFVIFSDPAEVDEFFWRLRQE